MLSQTEENKTGADWNKREKKKDPPDIQGVDSLLKILSWHL